jgi:hypothetical protein
MNTLKKITAAVLLGVLALGLNVPARADAHQCGFDFSAATAAVTRQIAADVASQMGKALSAPRVVRVRQSPSVTISEIAELVVVVATRLPRIDPIDDARLTRTAQVRL